MQVSSVSNLCPDKRGKKGLAPLFRLVFSVVLWRGRETANKHHWHVWGALIACAWTTLGCHNPRQSELSMSKPLRLPGAPRDTARGLHRVSHVSTHRHTWAGM